MLKNAWLQSLLRRPSQMKAVPEQYFRPAVFICDEYQAFASVDEDDPSGDEKSFALTRQCRCIPIVATQSISSLRSVLGSSEAWRTLLQTLRTRIFLSLSDDASAQIASALCGQVAKIKPSYTITESAKQSEVSMLSAQAGGGQGSVGASKSFREQREAVFQPREFGLALQLPGHLPALRWRTVALPDPRVPQTSLPAPHASLLAGEDRGETMSDGLELLKPFLPGLEDVLEDPEVSEIMINGPHNVWIEGHGKTLFPRGPAADRLSSESGGYPYRPAARPGSGHGSHRRCPPGRRIACGDLCSAGEPEGGDHRAALWQTGILSG